MYPNMDTLTLITKVSQILKNRLSSGDVRAFVFGSSLKKAKFYDIDIGLTGTISKETLALLRDDFEESDLPYNVDLVNLNSTTEQFKKNVFSENVVWLPL